MTKAVAKFSIKAQVPLVIWGEAGVSPTKLQPATGLMTAVTDTLKTRTFRVPTRELPTLCMPTDTFVLFERTSTWRCSSAKRRETNPITMLAIPTIPLASALSMGRSNK